MELIIRAVDADCQIFKKNLKFKFHALNSKFFEFSHQIRPEYCFLLYLSYHRQKFVHKAFLKKSSHLCVLFFLQKMHAMIFSLRYSGRLYIRGTRNQMYLV